MKFPGTWQGPEVPCERPQDLLGRIWIIMKDKSNNPIAGLHWSLNFYATHKALVYMYYVNYAIVKFAFYNLAIFFLQWAICLPVYGRQ